jgi:molybdopterin/thiamine biosynthesis adenylyltransferase
MINLKPIKLDLSKESVASFKKNNKVAHVVDAYEEILEDLFLIRNPRFKFERDHSKEFKEFLAEHADGKPLEQAGSWFYFPWNESLVHYLPDEMHQEVRTARNKNIITADEQKKFYDFRVAVAGMSVGSHPALTIALMGGARSMKLADLDIISASNLNRIRYDFTRIGQNKCAVAVEQIYQLNPYAEISAFTDGVTADNVHEFLTDVDLLIEEIDNLEMKIILHNEAGKRGIPVIMATDNGDNAIVDIERYDLDKDTEIFNGVVGKLTVDEFRKIPPQEMPKMATKIAGPKVVVPRMLTSLLQVGRTLYSWPQLGDAATLAGVAIAYLTKRLALGQKVKTGKLEINLDAIFDPDYDSAPVKAEREKIRADFMKTIGLED